jgi:hypothetical protein
MSTPWWGLLAGLVFGAVAVGMMLPIAFPDKRTALLGAFVDRLGIGIVIGCVQLHWPGWAVGLFFGLLLSLPSTWAVVLSTVRLANSDDSSVSPAPLMQQHRRDHGSASAGESREWLAHPGRLQGLG